LSDQINNLLQNQVSLRHRKSDRECLRNEAVDVPMNTIPAARTHVPIHCRLSLVYRHTAPAQPEYAIKDDGEVDDIAHHTSNILLAGVRVCVRQINGNCRRFSPASIYVVHPFSKVRTCGTKIRYFLNTVRVTHAPRWPNRPS
jgi:hypothetical protein